MNDLHWQDTTRAVLRDLAADRQERLAGSRLNGAAMESVASALAEEYPLLTAHDIAFHLLDWNEEAAFLLALHLFPERFTPEQIRRGVESLLIHAPNHIAAAAKLSGWPVTDIFEVDALNGRPPDGEGEGATTASSAD